MFLLPTAVFAQISGVVTNATTNTPQANVAIALIQPGAGGMQTLGSTTTDAQGKFRIDKQIPPGPALAQGTYKDVTYTTIITPGAPTEGLKLAVYDTTNNLASAKMQQHIFIFEPGEEMRVTETFLLVNETNQTFQDSDKGSVQIITPGAIDPKELGATVEGTAGMTIRRPLEKTKQAGVYKLAYAIKPGESRIDVHYTVPLSENYTWSILRTDGPSRMATPSGVTLEGTGFRDLGQEPRSQAHLYEATGATFTVKIKGSGSLNVGRQEDNAPKEDDGSPKVEVIDARIYSRIWWVMGLAFAMLGFGGAYLFRRGEA